MQLDIFSEKSRVTRGLKHGNIIIWNFKRDDEERFINCGLEYEIIEEDLLQCTTIGRKWDYKEK